MAPMAGFPHGSPIATVSGAPSDVSRSRIICCIKRARSTCWHVGIVSVMAPVWPDRPMGRIGCSASVHRTKVSNPTAPGRIAPMSRKPVSGLRLGAQLVVGAFHHEARIGRRRVGDRLAKPRLDLVDLDRFPRSCGSVRVNRFPSRAGRAAAASTELIGLDQPERLFDPVDVDGCSLPSANGPVRCRPGGASASKARLHELGVQVKPLRDATDFEPLIGVTNVALASRGRPSPCGPHDERTPCRPPAHRS